MNLIQKYKPLLISLFIASALVILVVKISQAADYDIICDANGCTSPGTAIFNETTVAPGNSVTKTIEIKNQHGETINMDMTASQNLGTDNDFLNVVDVVVQEVNSFTRFTGTLTAFLNNPAIDLGSLNAYKTKLIAITLTFQNVGNEFQGKQAKFDIPVHINVQSPAIGGGGGITTGTTGAATSPSPLPLGTVAGVFTSPISQVLGEATPAAESQLPSGFTAGHTTFNWWWPLVIQFFLTMIYYFLKRRNHRSLIILAVFPLILALLSQFIHSRLSCPADSQFCPWYWLFNLSIFILNILVFHFFRS